ncbi:Uncharacterised protein [BD1-7 clade bacterium]|uniref:CAAX prenyl protease 2/Lysostaphin resistance protein A-like domain-containing protein n=1 Tax=BD1-7 clade bacterium TaxID=2029982 RepID=A0A5S9QS49_9GAMM|nr:Uncharacterised protein [BD1-7 clade bacterium]CAA0121644.1 Uncharacterised protein [BD1-7 clade bacterium]
MELPTSLAAYLPIGLMVAGIVAALLRWRGYPLIVITALLAAMLAGQLTLVGLLIVAAGGVLAGYIRHQPARGLLYWGPAILLVALAFGLAQHLVPGFNNLQVIDHQVVKPNSVPFTLYLNIDRPVAALLILLAWPHSLTSFRRIPAAWLMLGIALLASIFAIALQMGIVRFAPAVAPWYLLFFVNNLLIVSFSEELLFRGLLLNQLMQRVGVVLALIISSAVFGLVHWPGGTAYMILAALTGIAYGLAFIASGRLWVAMLVHASFNTTHLLLFSYPLLATTTGIST